MENIKRHELFIDGIYENKDQDIKKLLDSYILIVSEYLELLKNTSINNDFSQRQIAINKLSNHIFSLMFELISNLKYDNYNSIFRLCRGILENKIFSQFIIENDETQAYWYNMWGHVKQVRKLDNEELILNYPYPDLMINAKKIYNDFITTYEKVYSNDYGFSQVSLGNHYITLKEITLKTHNAKEDYEYYKIFSDLSHAGNEKTNVVDYVTKTNNEYSTKLELKIYEFLCLSLTNQLSSIKEVFEVDYRIYESIIQKLVLFNSNIQQKNRQIK